MFLHRRQQGTREFQAINLALPPQQEIGQHASLGRVVGGILAALRGELFDVVAELAVEEGLRICADARNQPEVAERRNDAAVAGRAQLGGCVPEMIHHARLNAGSACAQNVLPGRSHRCSTDLEYGLSMRDNTKFKRVL
jgi:hypothetical protein